MITLNIQYKRIYVKLRQDEIAGLLDECMDELKIISHLIKVELRVENTNTDIMQYAEHITRVKRIERRGISMNAWMN